MKKNWEKLSKDQQNKIIKWDNEFNEKYPGSKVSGVKSLLTSSDSVEDISIYTWLIIRNILGFKTVDETFYKTFSN